MPAKIADRQRDPPPQTVVWDTSFAVDAIVKPKPGAPWIERTRHQEAIDLIKRFEGARTRVYYSPLLFAEFWDAILKIELKATHGPNFHATLQANPTIVSAHASRVKQATTQLDELLTRFPGRRQINPVKEVYALALDLIQKYPLRSYDALHIASGLHAGVTDFAVSDQHFEQVDNIVVWRNW